MPSNRKFSIICWLVIVLAFPQMLSINEAQSLGSVFATKQNHFVGPQLCNDFHPLNSRLSLLFLGKEYSLRGFFSTGKRQNDHIYLRNCVMQPNYRELSKHHMHLIIEPIGTIVPA